MLGDCLLVAPIFQDDSEVDYYLPDGTWTHLLSGETKEGGRWFHERYDYFSLPLYVRPNTLLAIGNNDQLPDYEYKNGIALQLYQLEDGKKAICEVPDTEGEIVLTAKVKREGQTLHISSDALSENMSYILHNIQTVKDIKGASYEIGKEGLKVIPSQTEITVVL